MSLKKLSVCLFISLSLLVPVSASPAVNANSSLEYSSEVSKTEAVAAALYQVKFDQALNEQSSWKGRNVTALQPIEVFDASNELHSYIVNLKIGEQPAGYVEIANNKNDFPILSYSYTVNNTEFDEEAMEDLNIADSKIGMDSIASIDSLNSFKKVRTKKVVWLAPGKFGAKVDYTDGSADLISENKLESIPASENTPVLAPEKSVNSESHQTWDEIEVLASSITLYDIGTDTDGVTDSLSFEFNNPYSSINSKYYNGVTNQKQYTSSLWDGPSGCAPTSGYNIFHYWHYSRGKTNLLKNKSTGAVDTDNTILLLRNNMQTILDESGQGSTDLNNIGYGLIAVARYKGYNGAASNTNRYASGDTVKSDLSYGPSIISMTGQTFFNNHSVTGVGYIEFIRNGSSSGHQYIDTYDNSQMTSTGGSVYIAYGREYSTLSSINFRID
ncbi:hypothetical protein CLHUN_19590 [Ruminiclostridium hungatei]|uniref:Peptidase C39-like domain-containing protein n=1 Tax=Ruminiclostridium hungatei TaxID=48256 RepID=A0A1V4SJW2_RUMHU|nr:hypothetical protein [Ruminiclostridium hungatei]OPX44160.1 hypothetical protein CLHUN_19590 [Ruminiclostridium hungatei]